jgi:rubrerythrin
MMLCFSFALAFCAYAEEAKTSETVQATPAPIPEATPAPQTVAVATTQTAEAVTPAPVPPAPVEKTTLDNLQAAFNGESNANARYLAFAKKADAEGYGKAASLFRAAARAEQVHFDRHARVIRELGGTPTAKIETPVVKSTAENLKAAMDGEIYESTIMYPGFLAKAEKDKIKAAVDDFEDTGKAEAVHASLYKKALENLDAWKGKGKSFEVCTFCGNVVEKINFMACPLCGKSKDRYMAVK